ncbi:MAG: phage major capsid protein [Gemmatimonadales bacterium]|nr:MAG: phage major capsid protein [Gemmatimonadales bacterium]
MSVAAQTITRTDLRVYAATRDKVMAGTYDHVFSHDPMTAIFLSKTLGDFGGVKLQGSGNTNQTGGAAVQIRVRLGKHSGDKRMAGAWDTHNTSPDDNNRLAEANWKHYSHALVISDTDKAINQGDEAMINFVADQTEAVMLALADTIGDDLQATAPATNAITTLDDLISAGDTVQVLNGATYDNWNCRGVSARGTAGASVDFASGSFAAQGIADMRTAFNNASEGMIKPGFIVTDYPTHERYEGTLQPLERFTGAVSTADASFQSLAFRTVPVMASPKTPGGWMWFLRTGKGGVNIKTLSGISFQFQPFKAASNQEAHVSELQWKGQLCIENRRYGNNKLTGITD